MKADLKQIMGAIEADEFEQGDSEKSTVRSIERNFLRTSWAFIVYADGERVWLNTRTGRVVPSSRGR